MESILQFVQQPGMRTLFGMLILLVVAWLAGTLTRVVLLRITRAVAHRTAWQWDDALFKHKVFLWLGRIVPAVLIQFGIALVPDVSEHTEHLVGNVAKAFVVFFIVVAITRALSALESLYRESDKGSRRSIKGVVQLMKLVLFIVATLVIIGTVTDQHIGLLLSGLGAMSAVLLLIFKDTILGFVAGVQLATNDMLRVGDWITMPNTGADGDVIEITLYTVKVRNFDKTIVTIPTWKLISESYQNWRGMKEWGGRRIKRSLSIDAASVHFLDTQEIARLGHFRLLSTYLQDKEGELSSWNRELGEAGEQPVNCRRLTNLGTFREYAYAYLKQHPGIHREMSCMVRQLASDARGIPLELYCFTNTTTWVEYENIQGDIFDHLFALLPEFGLTLYQQPSGTDLRTGFASVSARRQEEFDVHG